MPPNGRLSVPPGTVCPMVSQDRALAWYLAYQQGVLSRSQCLGGGLTPSALQHRLRRGGPWQRLLPGVYLTTTGGPTREQRLIASTLYAGADSLITGPAALANYRVPGPRMRAVDVLVPFTCKRTAAGFVVVHRTRRMPTEAICDGPIRYAPAERAVADTVRAMAVRDQAAVRAVVGGPAGQVHDRPPGRRAALGPDPRLRHPAHGAWRGDRRHPVPGRGLSADADPHLRATPAPLQPEALPA